MTVIVNGETKAIAEREPTVSNLLDVCGVTMPEMVSVQLNGTFVDRAAYGIQQVSEGDSVDFLYFMGGGAR